MLSHSARRIFWVLTPIIVLLSFTTSAQLLIDHERTDPGQIPDAWINQVKSDLHVAFVHTSHGSQLVTGMSAIENFPAFGTRYEWSDNGSSGLDFDDFYGDFPCSVQDLSQGDSIDDEFGVTPWVVCTRAFLDDLANAHINVMMWSWCSISGHDAQRYVDNMDILVDEYPDVHFIYMTGHAEGQGETTNVGSIHYNNELIRAHCAANNRILFDFADIESYDPNGAYFWDLSMYDNLNYTGGNWAQQWIADNPTHELSLLTTGNGVPGYDGCSGCAHSDSPSEANLNCVLKGRATWWLFARLAGWDDQAGMVFSDGFESGTTDYWQ